MEILPPKKVKNSSWVFGLITILIFGYGIGRMFLEDRVSANHPMVAYFAFFFYGVYALGAFLSVVILLRSATYVACPGTKSRSGLVLAFGLMIGSLSAVALGWSLTLCMIVTGTYSFAVSQWFDDAQLFNVLPAAICFCLVYRTAWALFKPFGKKFAAKKKPGYHRYLQAWGLLGSIFTLVLLPISLPHYQLCFSPRQLTQTWYIGAWIHGASIAIAGMELLIGIDLLLDRSKGKVSVGALLLGSSSVGFFTAWFCYLLMAAKIFEWGFGHHNVYIGSILFVILHRITTALLMLVLSNDKKDTYAVK